MKTKTAPAPAKPRRLEDLSEGRGGHFHFRFHQLTIPEDYNPRTEFTGIKELAESILAEAGRTTKSGTPIAGIITPLKVRKVEGTETIEVLDGERRYRAISYLITKGHDVGLIPCIPEHQQTSDLQRDLTPLVANTGQELTFLEKARQYQRIIDRHGIKPAELARRCQTTKQAVSDALRLVNEATPLLLSYVASGKMSGTTALAIIKQAHASGKEIDHLTIATELAAEASGSDHITPKHIPNPNGEPSFQAAAEPQQPEESDPCPSVSIRGSDSSPQPQPEPESSPENSNLNPSNPSFTLYQIEDAPADLIPGTTTRHETDRLVLTNAPDTIGLLHLLVAPTPNGLLSFGYRLNETEYLPDSSGHTGTDIDVGLRHALDTALSGYNLHPDDTDAIADALFNALGDYFPEEGEAKQPETLAFTPPAQVPDPNTGYQGIINAPSTNRDGSAPGGGEGGYSPPDKQMEKIEKMLDAIAEKGNGHEDRITTANLILNVLRNESSTLTLRSHLTGK